MHQENVLIINIPVRYCLLQKNQVLEIDEIDSEDDFQLNIDQVTQLE